MLLRDESWQSCLLQHADHDTAAEQMIGTLLLKRRRLHRLDLDRRRQSHFGKDDSSKRMIPAAAAEEEDTEDAAAAGCASEVDDEDGAPQKD